MTVDAVRVVVSRSDVEAVRRKAAAVARTLGASDPLADELTLVVSELATNLLRYSPGGEIRLTSVESPEGRPGLLIEAVDRGPGIPDVPAALTEGFTTAHGLGQGLPLVQRLTDTFTIESSEQGTRIAACRWITP